MANSVNVKIGTLANEMQYPLTRYVGGFFIKNIVVKCMKTDACHQAMSVYKGQAAQKKEL